MARKKSCHISETEYIQWSDMGLFFACFTKEQILNQETAIEQITFEKNSVNPFDDRPCVYLLFGEHNEKGQAILYAGSTGSITDRISHHAGKEKDSPIPRKQFKYVLWCWLESSPFTINDIIILETGLYSFISSSNTTESDCFQQFQIDNKRSPMEKRCSLLAGMKLNGFQLLNVLNEFRLLLGEHKTIPSLVFDEATLYETMTNRKYEIDLNDSSKFRNGLRKIRALLCLPSHEGTFDKLVAYEKLKWKYPAVLYICIILASFLAATTILAVAFHESALYYKSLL